MPDFAVIIPAYNEAGQLGPTIESVWRAIEESGHPGELIVVDNDSNDGTAALAEAFGARVVSEPHRQIARARNAGAAATKAPWLVFLDADTRLPAGLLASALQHLRSGEVAGGGATIAFDRPLTPFARFCLCLWQFTSRTFRWAAGSFVFVRHDAFDAVGGFSEQVYAGEEIFLSRNLHQWARRNAMRMLIIPAPPVVTSSRKFDWYPPWKIALVHLVLGLFPFLVRSRRFCAFWYQRPVAVKTREPAPPE